MSSTQLTVSKVKMRSSTCDGRANAGLPRMASVDCEPVVEPLTPPMQAREDPQVLQARARRISLGVAFIHRLSSTVNAARRANVANANANAQASLASAHKRSELERAHGATDAERTRSNHYDAGSHYSLISQQKAIDIDKELIDEYGFSADQLMELRGLASATAFARAYPRDTLPKAHGAVLVCCGPCDNGGNGLLCARYLKQFGYQPTIYYPKTPDNPRFKTLLQQCEKFEISSLAYLPSDLNLIKQSFNVLVDAFSGLLFKPPVKEEFADLNRSMRQIAIPIFSIDIPSGWDVEAGPLGTDAIQPDVLCSLTVPKRCSSCFSGRLHFLGGRFVPRLLAQKHGFGQPDYPGTEIIIELSSAACKLDETSPDSCTNNPMPTICDIWGAT